MPDHSPVTRRTFVEVLGASVMTGAMVPVIPSLLSAQSSSPSQSQPSRKRPRPTAAQLAWQRDELALFVHFGVNTFTDREWGDGTESPSIFNPVHFDARQWATAAQAAGAKAMILTAKHHDGFCLWPTRTTAHSVASSPWRDGKGDVVREFVTACRDAGLRAGLYCSPWDRNHPTYGDSERYNDVYMAQLTELLTQYGELNEVWFDGANGEGPNGKRQQYDWPRTWSLVRKLQPNAVIFSDAGPDVRWIGNERGVAGETCWSTIRSSAVPYIGASGDDVITALQEGHEDGDVWRPGETDVSIRPGWFHHASEDDKVRTVENLVSLYFTSVGRNSKLLLNVPPTRDGLFHETDVARLRGMRAALDAMNTRRVTIQDGSGRATSTHQATREIVLRRAATIEVLELAEDITAGQQVKSWEVRAEHSGGPVLARGTTIGHRQLRRIPPVHVTKLMLTYQTVDAPARVTVSAFAE